MTLKELKFLLHMKTTSNGGCYVTFKSVYDFWDIVEHDLKKGWTFCLAWELHQAGDIS